MSQRICGYSRWWLKRSTSSWGILFFAGTDSPWVFKTGRASWLHSAVFAFCPLTVPSSFKDMTFIKGIETFRDIIIAPLAFVSISLRLDIWILHIVSYWYLLLETIYQCILLWYQNLKIYCNLQTTFKKDTKHVERHGHILQYRKVCFTSSAKLSWLLNGLNFWRCTNG